VVAERVGKQRPRTPKIGGATGDSPASSPPESLLACRLHGIVACIFDQFVLDDSPCPKQTDFDFDRPWSEGLPEHGENLPPITRPRTLLYCGHFPCVHASRWSAPVAIMPTGVDVSMPMSCS